MELKQFFAQLRSNPEDEKIKQKADAMAAQYEERTGEPAPEEPGIEPDDVTDSILMAPIAPTRGVGAIARLGSKGMPAAAGAAEKAAASLSTREINAALRGASPRVQDMVLNQPGMMDKLKTEGLGLIGKLEEQIKAGTKSVARGSIGAKLRDQMPAPQSNPRPASTPYPVQPTRRPT